MNTDAGRAMNRRPLAAAIVALLFLVAWSLLPASPSGAEVLYGCARKTNGQVRIVSEPGKCFKSEYAVTLYGTADTNPLPRFEGELCWIIGSEPAIMRLEVTHVRNGHYALSGRISYDGAFYSAVHGTAVLDGNNLYVTLIDSGKDGAAMWVGTTHAILDRYSLNGTAEGIGHERRYADASLEINGIYADADTRYGSAPLMTLTVCRRK